VAGIVARVGDKPGGILKAGTFCALALLGIFLLTPLVALLSQASFHMEVKKIRLLAHMLHFSCLQAGISTVMSVLPALVCAQALARQGAFWGRKALVMGLQTLFLVPGVVIVICLICALGNQGFTPPY